MTPDHSPLAVQIENVRIQLDDVEDLLKAIRDQLSRIQDETREQIAEITCDTCEKLSSLDLCEALQKGWAEVYMHEGEFYGECPGCRKEEDAKVEATRRPTMKTLF